MDKTSASSQMTRFNSHGTMDVEQWNDGTMENESAIILHNGTMEQWELQNDIQMDLYRSLVDKASVSKPDGPGSIPASP